MSGVRKAVAEQSAHSSEGSRSSAAGGRGEGGREVRWSARQLGIVGGLFALVGRLLAVARRLLAVARGLLAVRLRPLTVAPRPARDLLGVAGQVAGIGDAVAAVRRQVATGREGVAFGRGGVAFGRGGVALGRRGVAHMADTRSRVGRLLTSACRATARFPATLIARLVCRPLIVAGRVVAISRHLVAVSRHLVALGRSLVLVGALLVTVRPRLVLVSGGLVAIGQGLIGIGCRVFAIRRADGRRADSARCLRSRERRRQVGLAPGQMMPCARRHEHGSHHDGHRPGDREAKTAPVGRVGRLLDQVQAERIHERKTREIEQHVAARALQAPQDRLDLGRPGNVELADQANANAAIGLVVLREGEVRAFTQCTHRGPACLLAILLPLPAAVHGDTLPAVPFVSDFPGRSRGLNPGGRARVDRGRAASAHTRSGHLGRPGRPILGRGRGRTAGETPCEVWIASWARCAAAR
jgi:hypothetical protein